MEKQTVQDKIKEIINELKGNDEFNINQVTYEAMEYANRRTPVSIESKYLDFYTYEVTKMILEKVENVLYVYAKEGKDSYIEVKNRVVPDIKVGDIRNVIYGDKLVKMRLNHILYSDRKCYVFANCDQSKFVRPMVVELFEDEVDEKVFKIVGDTTKMPKIDEISCIFDPKLY